MSDLISRKETYNELIESIDWLRERDYELYCVIGDSIRVCLDEQPTVFDVDKVVEKLKIIKEDALAEYNMGEYNLDNNIGNSISENYRKDMNEGRCFAYDEAIENVKQGDVSDASEDICEWELKNVCYTTSIKHYYSLPTSIVKTFNNCPYCGKKIKVVD